MPILAKITVTLLAAQFVAGLALMIYDAMQPTNDAARARLVTWLYIPPAVIAGLSFVIFLLSQLWRS